MKLTTRGRFAVTAMLDLALHEGQGPVTLCGISERQMISAAYLEQLFGKLRRQALVRSVRGPGGGYRLARGPSSISIADIITAVEEHLDATLCAGRENCHNHRRCMTHDLWANLNRCVFEYLSSVTLEQLVESQRSRPMTFVRNRSAGREAASPRG